MSASDPFLKIGLTLPRLNLLNGSPPPLAPVINSQTGAYLGAPSPFANEKMYWLLMWKKYDRISTLLKMYTWNQWNVLPAPGPPFQISKYGTGLRRRPTYSALTMRACVVRTVMRRRMDTQYSDWQWHWVGCRASNSSGQKCCEVKGRVVPGYTT